MIFEMIDDVYGNSRMLLNERLQVHRRKGDAGFQFNEFTK